MDGQLNGLCNVIVKDKQGDDLGNKYKTLFQSGLELPQSNYLLGNPTDHLWINLLLCLMVFIGVVIGALFKVEALYAAAAFYIIQFLEYCCSTTRIQLTNIESLEQVKNLLQEY